MKGGLRFALQVCLFGPLCVALLYVYAYIATQINLSYLFDARPMKLTALLIGEFLAGMIPAILFAYPFFWIYGRSAVAVSAIASALVALFRVSLIGKVHLPFVFVAFAVEISTFALCLPFTVWLIRNRSRDNSTRTMETPCAN